MHGALISSKTEMKAEKKRIYECEHYKYEYDGFDKYAWCRNRECLSKECIVDYTFCQDLCPFYKKNSEGRCIDIELSDHRYNEIRKECSNKLKKKAEEAAKDAAQAMIIAQQKVEYAKRFN